MAILNRIFVITKHYILDLLSGGLLMKSNLARHIISLEQKPSRSLRSLRGLSSAQSLCGDIMERCESR